MSFRYLALLGVVACTGSVEAVGSRGDALEEAATAAGLGEGTAEAQAVIAVANDRRLSVEDYVTKVRVSRVTAQAIVATRNGTNGVMESRPASTTSSAEWLLGGDDESFAHLAELDALPGTDEGAFRRLAAYARSNGYQKRPVLVAAGMYHSCSVAEDGAMKCWGSQQNGSSSPPADVFKFSAPSSSDFFSCALRTDDTVACWGDSNFGAATPPEGKFRQISAGTVQSCGVRIDGTVACWGVEWHAGLTPSGSFDLISAGNATTCGIRSSDHGVTCWGNSIDMIDGVPSGPFATISANNHVCGLRPDSTLACWGENTYGQASPPSGRFTAVAAGLRHTCALREDRTLACWGENGDGQSSPPAGRFVQVATGGFHSCAVRETGGVACWGHNAYGQAPASVP